MNLRTLLLLSMVVGLSYNWNLINDGVKKLQAAILPDDISILPDWVDGAFKKFQSDYGKTYNPAELVHRMKVFFANMQMIQFNNDDSAVSYVLGENEFMDMEKSEFIGQILMKSNLQRQTESVQKRQQANLEQSTSFLETNAHTQGIPNVLDWRSSAVTSIKNQGKCGSCWTFSVTGALEGHSFLSKKELKSFSQQHLLDCCPYEKYYCEGCSGSWPADAFGYVKNNGIAEESQYRKYDGKKQKCAMTTADYTINDFKYVSPTVKDLKAAVSRQPISVVIYADDWQFYKSGVFDGCDDNGTDKINHAVLLIGYDEKSWIVKNSWGTKWGENGYIRLKMVNECGILQEATYPIL